MDRSRFCSYTFIICSTENYPESKSASSARHCLYRVLPWWKAVYNQNYLEEIKANKMLTGAMQGTFTQIWRKLQHRYIKGWVCHCHNSTLISQRQQRNKADRLNIFSGIFSSSEPDGTFWFQIPTTHIDSLSIDFGMIREEEQGSSGACN